MTREALRARLPGAVAVLQAFVVLGPALGPGVVLAYDMPWSPDPRWTPFVLGLGTPAPRAVPSDAVAVAAGWLAGAGLAQAVILGAILVGLGTGCAALLAELAPGTGTAGRVACVVLAVWNPFVSERLFVGQWVVLLGLAVVPFALRAAVRVLRGTGGAYAVALTCVVAGVGGVNSVLVVSLAVFPVLVVASVRSGAAQARVALGAALATVVGVSSGWALPGLASDVRADASGVEAFAPTADSDLGVLGSILSGGGFWNTAAHPAPRDQLLIALAALVLSVAAVTALALHLRPRRESVVVVPALLGLAVVLWSSIDATGTGWGDVVTALPGGGALRDSHKLLAPWVVTTAVGFGWGLDQMARRATAPLRAPITAASVALAVLLSPQLFWGLGGRLDAVEVPESYRTGAKVLSALPDGEVGLLPWNQYRRYAWNGSRVSLTLAPRIVDQRVLFDDSLPLRSGVVGGEVGRATEVSRALAAGREPVAALRDAGVRYVAAELGTGLPVDSEALRGAGEVVVDEPTWLVVDLNSESARDAGGVAVANLVGWFVTTVTALAVVGLGVARQSRRRLLAGLLRSRP